MTAVRLFHLTWYKQFNLTDKVKYTANFTYHVEGIGEIKTEIELPIEMAEKLDSFGQKALWSRIDEIKKD